VCDYGEGDMSASARSSCKEAQGHCVRASARLALEKSMS